MLVVAAVTPAAAGATGASPLLPLLLKSGDVSGLGPGKAQVFRTAAAVKEGSGERLPKRDVRRLEENGFVEGATTHIHVRSEPSALGFSSVAEFETPAGAEAEMKARFKEVLDPAELRKEGLLDFLTLKHFKVPGVPTTLAFAFLTKRVAAELGLEMGIANGFFVEGRCLLTEALFRQESVDVIDPVRGAIQALAERAEVACSS